MATVVHLVTDPEGRTHEITGPADAKPEEVIAAAQHLIGRTQAGVRGLPPEPGQPEPGNYGLRPIEPGSREEQIHEVGKTLIPLIYGAGAGGALGKGVSTLSGAAPRLLPALGRILGTGTVGGAQTPGDLSDKALGGAKAAGSAAAVETALPLLVGGSKMLKSIRGLVSGEGPGVENLHIKSAPPVPEPNLVQLPDQLRAGAARRAGGLPANPPPPAIPDPHDPRLNIVDAIRSKYGLNMPKGPSVPASVQTATDAVAGTPTGENASGTVGLGLLGQALSRLGLGAGGRRPTFQHSGTPGS